MGTYLGSDVMFYSNTDAVKSGSLASIATVDSDNGNDEALPAVVPPPAIETLVLSNTKMGNAAIEQVSEDNVSKVLIATKNFDDNTKT